MQFIVNQNYRDKYLIRKIYKKKRKKNLLSKEKIMLKEIEEKLH